jgi:hypothetical protein
MRAAAPGRVDRPAASSVRSRRLVDRRLAEAGVPGGQPARDRHPVALVGVSARLAAARLQVDLQVAGRLRQALARAPSGLVTASPGPSASCTGTARRSAARRACAAPRRRCGRRDRSWTLTKRMIPCGSTMKVARSGTPSRCEDPRALGQLALRVREHRERQVLQVVMAVAPREVHELRVGAHPEQLGVAVGEVAGPLPNSGDLGRAHEREVHRPEEVDLPLAGSVKVERRGRGVSTMATWVR